MCCIHANRAQGSPTGGYSMDHCVPIFKPASLKLVRGAVLPLLSSIYRVGFGHTTALVTQLRLSHLNHNGQLQSGAMIMHAKKTAPHQSGHNHVIYSPPHKQYTNAFHFLLLLLSPVNGTQRLTESSWLPSQEHAFSAHALRPSSAQYLLPPARSILLLLARIALLPGVSHCC